MMTISTTAFNLDNFEEYDDDNDGNNDDNYYHYHILCCIPTSLS